MGAGGWAALTLTSGRPITNTCTFVSFRHWEIGYLEAMVLALMLLECVFLALYPWLQNIFYIIEWHVTITHNVVPILTAGCVRYGGTLIRHGPVTYLNKQSSSYVNFCLYSFPVRFPPAAHQYVSTVYWHWQLCIFISITSCSNNRTNQPV